VLNGSDDIVFDGVLSVNGGVSDVLDETAMELFHLSALGHESPRHQCEIGNTHSGPGSVVEVVLELLCRLHA